MTIDVFTENRHCRIRIEEELTIYTASVVGATIRDAMASHDSVAIDLTGVTEIDTAGLQLLLVAKKEALLRQRLVKFIGHNRVIAECLLLVNLANFFKFEAPAEMAA